MSLVCLVYVSLATHPMTHDELRSLLQEIRKKNQIKNITGMLLHRDSFFLQAIEGEDTEVEILFEKIKHDPRHHSILKVYKNPITERTFSDWSMGFNLIDDADPEGLDGYSDFLSRPNTEYFLKSPSRAKILLESFKERVYF